MKDLLQLAKRHGLENNLYYGNALDEIFKLIGDNRFTRWLSTSYNLSEGEEQWNHLIQFLEQEIKIYQQKALYTSKHSDSAQHGIQKPNKSYYQNQDDLSKEQVKDKVKIEVDDQKQSQCFICGELDDIKTNGPLGMKLIQYFVCKKFVEMSPDERYQILKSKGYCIQCLFPGAKWNKGRHKDGNCQRNYA